MDLASRIHRNCTCLYLHNIDTGRSPTESSMYAHLTAPMLCHKPRFQLRNNIDTIHTVCVRLKLVRGDSDWLGVGDDWYIRLCGDDEVHLCLLNHSLTNCKYTQVLFCYRNHQQYFHTQQNVLYSLQNCCRYWDQSCFADSTKANRDVIGLNILLRLAIQKSYVYCNWGTYSIFSMRNVASSREEWKSFRSNHESLV